MHASFRRLPACTFMCNSRLRTQNLRARPLSARRTRAWNMEPYSFAATQGSTVIPMGVTAQDGSFPSGLSAGAQCTRTMSSAWIATVISRLTSTGGQPELLSTRLPSRDGAGGGRLLAAAPPWIGAASAARRCVRIAFRHRLPGTRTDESGVRTLMSPMTTQKKRCSAGNFPQISGIALRSVVASRTSV